MIFDFILKSVSVATASAVRSILFVFVLAFRGVSAYIQLYTITFIPLSIQLCEFYSNFCDHVCDRLKILHLLLCVSFRHVL